MWRDDRWACVVRRWLVSAVCALVGSLGQAQAPGAPVVSFLEPQDGTVIPADAETVTIRFRLVSPDGVNLMRYQPFVNGHPGNDPIPIDPPAPQVELTMVWRGVRQFPDAIYTITVRAVDAKGREGSGTLTLVKGRGERPAQVEILQPRSGELVRGKVMIFVRARDEKGLQGLVVRAREQATARDQSIYTGTLHGQQVEVQVAWDTTSTHPQTGEPLFPDGVYLLQAWVLNEDKHRIFSNEVLVVVQNRVAQPVLSQVAPAPPPRGGATLGTGLAVLTGAHRLMVPSVPIAPLCVLLTPYPTRFDSGAPTVAVPSATRWPLRFVDASVTPSSVPVRSPSALSSTEVAQPQRATPSVTARSPLQFPTPQEEPFALSRQVGFSTAPLNAVPKVANALAISRSVPTFSSSPTVATTLPKQLTPEQTAVPVLPAPVVAFNEQQRTLQPVVASSVVGRAVLPTQREAGIAAQAPEPERILPHPMPPRVALPQRSASNSTSVQPALQPLHGFRYTVIAGDTLKDLAERFGVDVHALASANELPVDAPLRIGQRLWVPARPVKVWVDGRLVQSPLPAFIRNDTVVGPLRAVVEASGGSVDWDNTRKQAIAVLGPRRIAATIGHAALQVNGEAVPLSIAPFLLGNRTFLPLRPLGQAMGKTVEWWRGTLRLNATK